MRAINFVLFVTLSELIVALKRYRIRARVPREEASIPVQDFPTLRERSIRWWAGGGGVISGSQSGVVGGDSPTAAVIQWTPPEQDQRQAPFSHQEAPAEHRVTEVRFLHVVEKFPCGWKLGAAGRGQAWSSRSDWWQDLGNLKLDRLSTALQVLSIISYHYCELLQPQCYFRWCFQRVHDN